MHYNKTSIVLLLLIGLCSLTGVAQSKVTTPKDSISPSILPNPYKPLAPARAAFYSAVLPGLGQAFNGKYWKVPIVYAALGTSVYAYSFNNTNYKKYQKAFKLRENGKVDDFDGLEGRPFLTVDALERAQKSYRKDRDLSLLAGVGIYVLQIVEASVNAHLLQFNVNENLSYGPQFTLDPVTRNAVVGAGLNIKF
ncbi:MAG: hypothetical protein COB60_08595 [Flavobacteriaceae bacterium]|nr:MAG: hypothetical protein COB60_08595 [Flavobacteriaceae bacterium]